MLAYFTFFLNNTMRIIHFSDFHLRKDHIERAKATFERLLEALKRVNQERKIDLIIFSGDLIDKAGDTFEEPKISTSLHTYDKLVILRKNGDEWAKLNADFAKKTFEVIYSENGGEKILNY